ncbi:MAG: sigma-70 family RNA polymerase sigma factor [Nannocystaceae bacterium]
MSSSPDLQPLTSTSLATSPAPRTTKPQLVFLVAGLVLFVVLWAIPLAFSLWSSTSILGGVGIAELLEHTRGLAPTTYRRAFWLATALTVAMVALEVRAMLGKDPGRRSRLVRFVTRPSTALIVLFVPTLLLVRIDIRGTDVPDTLTTTLLLCCLGYLWLILPLGLASVSWRLTRWMWRLGRGSSFAAGIFGMLGIAFGSCMPVVCASVDDDEDRAARHERRINGVIDRAFDHLEDEGVVDGSRAVLESVAEAIDGRKAIASLPAVDNETSGDPPVAQRTTQEEIDADLFRKCVKKLLDGKSSSLRNRKVSRFMSNERLDRAVAEDIVQDAVLKLCTRHATVGRVPYANIEAVFNLRADSRRKNWERDRARRQRCLTSFQVDPRLQYTEPAYVESQLLDAALCRLDEIDRSILELSALDHDHKSIGRELGLSPSAVRQRKHRALKQIRSWLQLH